MPLEAKRPWERFLTSPNSGFLLHGKVSKNPNLPAYENRQGFIRDHVCRKAMPTARCETAYILHLFSVTKILDICIKFVRPKVLSPSGVNVLVYSLMLVFQCFEEN